MNYFIEGIQGAGKSTLVGRLAEKLPHHQVFREGDYSPVELAWCAYLTEGQYRDVLRKYAEIQKEIEANVAVEPDYKSENNDRCVIKYTRILTDIPGFHKDLENYEIYNGRYDRRKFEEIILTRFGRWKGRDQIFECSIFQNIVENQILYYEMTDDEILEFYARLKQVLGKREYKILYLEVEKIAEGIEIIRRERVDQEGNEMWFPLMMEYLRQSPYGLRHGWQDFDDLVAHLEHRKTVELRLLREIFPEHAIILKSKDYDLTEI